MKKPPAKPVSHAAPTPAVAPLVDTLTGDARTDYQAGTVLFGDGDFATALQKFKNAYEKQPDARLL
jgi:TolA-binding protein